MTLDEIKEVILGDFERVALGNPTFIKGQDVSLFSFDTTALSMIGSKLLDEFRTMIENAVRDDIPGHIVETGVWRGGACIWAAAVLESLGSDKFVYVCDSFEGLPPAVHPKETIDFGDSVSLRVSQEDVEDNFQRLGLEHRAVFVKGWFKDTMPGLDIPVSVLRLDGDMYESTNDVLKYMYDRVSPGGYIIIDDYQLPSCRMAVNEFRSRRHIRGTIKDRAGTWWRK